MKKSFVLLFFFLLLSCSNEGFESQLASSSQKEVWCKIDENCVEITRSLCLDMNGKVFLNNTACLTSSSSEDGTSSSSEDGASSSSEDGASSSSEDGASSSSIVVVGSSSSNVVGISSSSSVVVGGSSSSNVVVGSSSSDIGGGSSSSNGSSSSLISNTSSSSAIQTEEPETNCGLTYDGAVNTCETFTFRNFHNDAERGYYLDSTIYASNTSASSRTGSHLYHNLSITNMQATSCVPVSIEIAGGGLTSIQYRSNGSNTTIAPNPITSAGTITAKAVTTCGGVKKVLATTTATAIARPNPSFSECNMPSYVGKDETIDNLKFISIENDKSCGAITYTIAGTPGSPTKLNLQTGTQTLTITANNTKCGLSATCNKPGVTVVANNVRFTELDKDGNIPATGTTVIVLPDDTADKFGCKGVNNSGTFNYKLNGGNFIKGTSAQKEGNDWWVVTDIPADAASKGNRFLLDTNGEALICLIAKW